MFTPILPAPSKHASGQHQYGTRTRSNSVIKPSIRLRQSPDAPQPQRRIKPAPSRKNRQASVDGPCPAPPDCPPFPPAHVFLHPEDANNKVFLALGRALMSIENRAITVKDLAELAMKFGLSCQNVSAAGQAIATFIRTHYARCEAQDDQPLLLKHNMSGTVFDDDLVPALYSRIGGAHCTLSEVQNRLTNFRRGTQVWYLSKAAGAPCPFARAGIRICEYNEDGKIGTVPNPGRERKRERDRLRKAAQTCGQKRKRLPRSCADKGSPSSDSSDAEEEERPPKVKLTLRLRPCLTSTPGASSSSSAHSASYAESPQPDEADYEEDTESDSDTDSMSVEDDADDTTEPGSAPPRYAQGSAEPSPRKFSLPESLPPPLAGFPPPPSAHHRRSMSLPYSEMSGSPPPDSEAEDDDYHITMTDARRLYSRSCTSTDDEDSAWDGDFFGDVDADTETQWDSPGPRSPSVQIEDEVVVKQEPTDVRGLLDAWEDLESRATDMKVIDIVAQAAAAERQMEEQAASDDLSKWTWPGTHTENTEHIKQEDVEPILLFSDSDFTPPSDSASPIVQYDPYDSPVEECPFRFDSGPSYDLQWRDVEILGPDSVKPRDLEDGAWHEYRGRPATPEEPSRSLSPEASTATAASSPKLARAVLPPLDVKSTDVGASIAQARNMSITSPSLIASLTSLSIQTPTTSAPSAQCASGSALAGVLAPASGKSCVMFPSQETSLEVHTVERFDPAISATQFEGVPVYQMTLGSSTLFRRIDTDFVNISPIAQHFGIVCPSVPTAVIVTGGSPGVCGTWVPLDVAHSIAKGESILETFLSDGLRSLFPASLNLLHPPPVDQKPSRAGYGHQFKSASEARRRSMTSHRLELPPREFEVSWEDHLSTHPPFILATSAIDGHRPVAEEPPPVVEALSPTEEEMFHVLCADPEWDAVTPAPTEERPPDVADAAVMPVPPTNTAEVAQEPPLRRSKRVANAVTTRSRTRSSKRGSRTSLS
ncbi:hypothetical protein OH77DRAFT_3602 [Trametes cingulata]|nr:hypothetical protein OH77DRAFT_3602 [Trametes cingulata]